MMFVFGQFNGLGTTASDCGANSSLNTTSGKCECNAGYSWADEQDPNNMNCVAGCKGANFYRSPVDLYCHCAPGYADFGNGCESKSAFPSCKDQQGNSIPGCFLGVSLVGLAVPALVGIGIGLLGGLFIGRKSS